MCAIWQNRKNKNLSCCSPLKVTLDFVSTLLTEDWGRVHTYRKTRRTLEEQKQTQSLRLRPEWKVWAPALNDDMAARITWALPRHSKHKNKSVERDMNTKSWSSYSGKKKWINKKNSFKEERKLSCQVLKQVFNLVSRCCHKHTVCLISQLNTYFQIQVKPVKSFLGVQMTSSVDKFLKFEFFSGLVRI